MIEDDEPTICSLKDTIYVLSKRKPDWLNDNFCKMIFAWNSDLYNLDHVEEICQELPLEIKELCLEYREHKTMNGNKISESFGDESIQYIFFDDIYHEEIVTNFGSSPVREAYFQVENN